jgi:hypothetical protein
MDALETKGGSNAATDGSTHSLWIGEHVLDIHIDKSCNGWKPNLEQCHALNTTIQGLARAAKAVIFHSQNDPKTDITFAMDPISDIADAIILLTQLSDAVQHEVNRPKP